MLRDTAVSLIGLRLGQRTDLTSAILLEMQEVQNTVLEQHEWLPWFLESEMASADCTADDERLPLPSDFLGELEEAGLWLYDATAESPFTELSKGTYDELLRKHPTPAKPRAYAITGSYFLLKPTPDAVYSFKMRYYQADAILDTNIENKWLANASDLVMALTGVVMAEKYLQNGQLADRFKQDAGDAWARLYKRHVAWQEANQTRRMGDL